MKAITVTDEAAGDRRDEAGGPARAQLTEIVQRVRDGRLRTHIGMIANLDDAVATFNSKERHPGKTIIRVR